MIEAITHESWVEAMKEELSQFERNQVSKFVPLTQDKTIIGTTWIFKKKKVGSIWQGYWKQGKTSRSKV